METFYWEIVGEDGIGPMLLAHQGEWSKARSVEIVY